MTICPLCPPPEDSVLWSSARLWVIRVDEPALPGFIRVIWRSHVAEMSQLADDDREHLMRVVYHVESLQRKHLQPDKMNLASLGNQVPHLHWHLIPRWRSDLYFPDPIWAPPSTDPARIKGWTAFCAALQPKVEHLHRQLPQTLSIALANGTL